MSITPNISDYNHRRKHQFAERSCTSIANFGQYNSDNALSFLKQIVRSSYKSYLFVLWSDM